VVVETEAYSQDNPACHGYRRRTSSNATLFGEPGRFYVYVSFDNHRCVNVVALRASQTFRSHYQSRSSHLSPSEDPPSQPPLNPALPNCRSACGLPPAFVPVAR